MIGHARAAGTRRALFLSCYAINYAREVVPVAMTTGPKERRPGMGRVAGGDACVVGALFAARGGILREEAGIVAKRRTMDVGGVVALRDAVAGWSAEGDSKWWLLVEWAQSLPPRANERADST